MKKYEQLGRKLSRIEAKGIFGGVLPEEDFGCGTGISCTDKKEGDKCGTKTCLCEKHSSTDNTLYCSSQL